MNRCFSGALAPSAFIALLAVGFVAPAHAGVGLTRDQVSCINAINKDYAKLVSTQAKEMCGCFKNFAKFGSVLPEPEGWIENCSTDDPKGKVQKTLDRLTDDAVGRCQGFDDDGLTKTPPFGPIGDGSAGAGGISNQTGLFHDVLGFPFEDAIVPSSGPTSADSKCQLSVTKAMKKCQDTKLKEFVACKKLGLRDVVTSAVSLEETCLMTSADPTTQQPDDRGKIAKSCATGIDRAVSKKCGSVDMGLAFPGLALATAGEIERAVECRVCLGLNQADNLARDCDLFDNGVADLSCSGCIDATEIVADSVPSEVCVPNVLIVEEGFTVDVCPARLDPPPCAEGEGCGVAVAADPVIVDIDAGTATFTGSVDGSGFVASADLGSGPLDCVADVLTADVAVNLEFSTLPTQSGAAVVDTVTSATSDVTNVVLQLSGNPLCAIAAQAFLSDVEAQMEAAIDGILADEVAPLVEGQGLCLY